MSKVIIGIIIGLILAYSYIKLCLIYGNKPAAERFQASPDW